VAALDATSRLGVGEEDFAFFAQHTAPHSLDSCQCEGVRGMEETTDQALRICELAYAWVCILSCLPGEAGGRLLVSGFDLEIKPRLRNEPIVV